MLSLQLFETLLMLTYIFDVEDEIYVACLLCMTSD